MIKLIKIHIHAEFEYMLQGSLTDVLIKNCWQNFYISVIINNLHFLFELMGNLFFQFIFNEYLLTTVKVHKTQVWITIKYYNASLYTVYILWGQSVINEN